MSNKDNTKMYFGTMKIKFSNIQYFVFHFFLSSAIKYLETPIELVPNIATGVIMVKIISSFGNWSKELQDLNEKTSEIVGWFYIFLDTFTLI